MTDFPEPTPSYAPSGFSEDTVEQAAIGIFEELGYTYLHGSTIAPDAGNSERRSYGDVFLMARLKAAVDRLNPDIPEDARDSALRQLTSQEFPSLVEENRRVHKLLTEGADVEYSGDDGAFKGDKVYFLDLNDATQNDWLVVNQFTVIEARRERRPDMVVFVNGLPLVVVELKNAADANATLRGAYNQIETYKEQIPSLFRTNALNIISDGMAARIGSLTAGYDRFMPWRSVNGETRARPGINEIDTLLRGALSKEHLLALIRDFAVFGDKGQGAFKIVGGWHQFFGARKAIAEAERATAADGDKKIGVVWHTQGSGKSFLMAFFAGLAVKSTAMRNPTLLIITDRNDLDDQLYGTFSTCRDLIRQKPHQASGRDELRDLLKRESGGVIFTTVQKFSPEEGEDQYPVLTDRDNVIVMADEAHRSQYGFKGKMTDGEMKYGFAKYIRDALPNASYIGFTGTPIEGDDVNTPAVFGEYIDIYDISAAVEDGATVPLFYESRLARIELDEELKPQIDAEIEAIVEDDTLEEREKFKQKWSTVEALVGADQRLSVVAADMVAHLEARIEAMGGKAMMVAMSRKICVNLYNEIIKLRPDWHSEDPTKGAVKVVMTGAASDPIEWQMHIGNKKHRDDLANRARDPNDPLKLIIVRDMWLTGFDAPCMHTMYVDKPMRSHNLMQAIARVNRVFEGKEGGLIVDYIGIAQNLKNALGQYTQNDQQKTGIDAEEAIAVMHECYEVVCDIFNGFDYSKGLNGKPQERMACLGDAIDWVMKWQERQADDQLSEEEKKKVHRAYQNKVLALSKAYSLCAASDEGRAIRDEVGFFQAVRAALVKTMPGKTSGKGVAGLAVQQLINKAVVSTEIVDILKAAGMKTPDISILSDEFLLEIQNMKQKNLALEALKKLLNGEIKSREKVNVVEARNFSDRLSEAVSRYHAGAISTLEMLQMLVDLGHDVKAAKERGEEAGLSQEEVAFYDALSKNESAMDIIGDDKLVVIAQELVIAIQNNITVDWHNRENARARMRLLVKKILKKHGFPPDLSDVAVKQVLEQAEITMAGI